MALVHMAFSRMAHLIKNGIRGFLCHDYFPGWGNCALHGRLSTSADTIISGITYTICWIAPYQDLSSRFSSSLAYLHLYCLSLVSLSSDTCRSGNCYLMKAPIFTNVSEKFHCVWKQNWWTGHQSGLNMKYFLYFFLFSAYIYSQL